MRPALSGPMGLFRRRWRRRDFLRAAGVGAAATALAPMLPQLRADAADGPRRLVLLTSAQGTDMTRWRPTGTETDFVLSEQLDPLAAYQDRMIVLDGVDNVAAHLGVQSGHFGCSTLWTGVGIPAGTVREEGVGWPQAASVDRLIASRIGAGTNFDAFYWGLWPTTFESRSNQGPNGIAHHRGPDQPIDPEIAPDRAFDRLFDGVTGDAAQIARLRAERRSVLDVVRGEIGRVRAELPVPDRDRLDAHLEGIRTLEGRLEALRPMCIIPERPATMPDGQLEDFTNHPYVSSLQFELVALALACDLTRVACFHWSHSEGSGSFMEAEGYRDFGSFHVAAHEMSYETVDDVPVTDDQRRIARENMGNMYRWRASALATGLLDRMLPDVRDNTLVVWTSEMSEGGTHSNYNIPLVLIPGAGIDAFRTGRYLRFGSYDPLTDYGEHGGQPMNKVLVSICHAMGLEDVTSVGDPSIESGPLEELA